MPYSRIAASQRLLLDSSPSERTLIEYVYPRGFLTRRVNNSGDISWHKDRVFISEGKFDRFRPMFNYERPHEGLNNLTPGSLYQPSSVMLPRTDLSCGGMNPRAHKIRL